MAKGRTGIYETWRTAGAVREGYGVTATGDPVTGTVVECAGLLACDGIATETVANGQLVTICRWGEVDLMLGAGALARGALVAVDATGVGVAAGANDAVCFVTTGADAAALCPVIFGGGVRMNVPV